MPTKNEIIKFQFKGEMYYFYNGQIVDTSFIAPHESELKQVAEFYFGNIDYKAMSIDEIKDFIKYAKQNLATNTAFDAIVYLFDGHSLNNVQIRHFLPILTSLCRQIGQPSLAIEYATDYIAKDEYFESVVLLISLASSYCDVKDYHKALSTCDKAYAKQGGSVGYKNELSLVYARIRKESDIDFEDRF